MLPFDLCKLAGLNFLFSIYGFFDSFFLDGPLIMLFSTWPDFFFGFIENYLVLDLFSTISPQDKLYFFLFSAIISLKLLVSSYTDLLFHLLKLLEHPLAFRFRLGASPTASEFLLLLSFFNLILSLQKILISLSLDLDKLPLTSEATKEECGRPIIRLAREAFSFV